MRALFDINHPADVLFFEGAIRALRKQGHGVLVSSRVKDETQELLDGLDIAHTCLSRMGGGVAGMGRELVVRSLRLFRIARRFRPDVMTARTGVAIGLVGRALGIPAVAFEDTECAWLQTSLCAPFATVLCTGMGYGRRFPGKELHVEAPFQLAYTHPDRFRPDPGVLRRWGIAPGEPYFVVRVKAWRALHDVGVRGPRDDEIVALVEALRAYARPIVSAERPLPPGLASYENPVPPQDGLHLLAFARLYVGEGSSMAAEAACLGTPAVFLSPVSRRGYLDAMERRYGHVRTVRTAERATELACKWLSDPAQQGRAEQARRRLVSDCEDPGEFVPGVLLRFGAGARGVRTALPRVERGSNAVAAPARDAALGRRAEVPAKGAHL